MPITEAQRLERIKYIGSSDTPAIMGFSPWASPYDVWLEKRGLLEPSPETEAQALGNMLENPLLDWCAAKIGKPIEKNVGRVHPLGILAANHDALVVRGDEGLEAKTAGILSGSASDDWGDPGTDQVPAHVLLQAQHQMIVSDLKRVWVPAIIARRGRLLYCIERSEDLCSLILTAASEFWTAHVQAGVPPADARPSLDVVKRVRRLPGNVAQLPGVIVQDWLDAKESEKQAKKASEVAEALLLAALGESEAGDSPMGRITYLKQTRKSFVMPESTFRVLRLKKVKGAIE